MNAERKRVDGLEPRDRLQGAVGVVPDAELILLQKQSQGGCGAGAGAGAGAFELTDAYLRGAPPIVDIAKDK